jgi:hypothetical protein
MAFLPPSPCATLNRNLRNLCNLRMSRFRILVGIIGGRLIGLNLQPVCGCSPASFDSRCLASIRG